MLECAYDDIAEDIVGELSDRHGMHDIMDGGTDPYDDTNDIFEMGIPRSREFEGDLAIVLPLYSSQPALFQRGSR